MIDVKNSNEAIEQLSDISHKCIDCKKCMKNCSMLEHNCSSPKQLIGKTIESGTIDKTIPYSCTGCGYCKNICPKDIDLGEMSLMLKRLSVNSSNGKPSIKGYNTVNFHQKNSFSSIFTAAHLEKISDDNIYNKTRVFMPGCSLTSYNPELVMKTYGFLKERLNNTGIILKCCGNPTALIGQEHKFNEYYSMLEKDFFNMNVDEVIVACPSCYKAVKKNSPNIKVRSLWEVINEIGIPEEMKCIGKNIDITFAIHDPCITRNETSIHDAVRNIVKELDFNIEEFEYSREKTLCCGAGGMVAVTNNKLAKEQMKKRASQAKSDYILTYCESCVEAMMVGGKNSVHILDLLFNKDIYSTLKFNQPIQGVVKKWSNRYRCKKMIERL